MMHFLFLLLFFFPFENSSFPVLTESPLTDKVICIDPGHGGTALTDNYRVGPGGEREEWINLRVALLLRDMLVKKGAKVILTRERDDAIALEDRARIARDQNSDIFISIHHNATADTSVNFPIIYFHGNASENLASVAFGKLLASGFAKVLYLEKTDTPSTSVSLVSDFTIFPTAGASILRNTYGIPAVIAEASFFSNGAEEQRLKSEEYNRLEALAYLAALELFFTQSIPASHPKNSKVSAISPFKVFQEAERMTPIAKRWKQDFEEGLQLMHLGDKDSLEKALELFTRSARSFPDSYIAAKCHEYRSMILQKTGKGEEAEQEALRRKEYYVSGL